MSEDELATYLMEEFSDESHYLEVHYNHYGTRGVVDLVSVNVASDGSSHTIIRELKADHAVRESTGANEILRQFKKQIGYFEDGCEEEILLESVQHVLTFKASLETVQHVKENLSMYANPNLGGRVLIREVGEIRPVIATPKGLIVQQGSGWLGEYVSLDNPKVVDCRGGNDE